MSSSSPSSTPEQPTPSESASQHLPAILEPLERAWGWLRRKTEAHQQTMSSLTWGLLILVLLVTAAGSWLAREQILYVYHNIEDQAVVRDYIQGFGGWGLLILFFFQFAQVIIPVVPGHPFLAAAGYIYGAIGGFIFNWATTVIASQVVFLLARWGGRPVVERFLPPEVIERWDDLGRRYGFTFFLYSFLFPVIPSDAMNLIAGLSSITSLKFFGANVVGRAPGVLGLTLVGAYGLELTWLEWAVVVAVALPVLIGGHLLSRRILQRYGVARGEA